MGDANVSQATLLAGLVFANVGLIVGAYVSIKVSIAKLEVKVDALVKDVDAVWNEIRKNKKKEIL